MIRLNEIPKFLYYRSFEDNFSLDYNIYSLSFSELFQSQNLSTNILPCNRLQVIFEAFDLSSVLQITLADPALVRNHLQYLLLSRTRSFGWQHSNELWLVVLGQGVHSGHR